MAAMLLLAEPTSTSLHLLAEPTCGVVASRSGQRCSSDKVALWHCSGRSCGDSICSTVSDAVVFGANSYAMLSFSSKETGQRRGDAARHVAPWGCVWSCVVVDWTGCRAWLVVGDVCTLCVCVSCLRVEYCGVFAKRQLKVDAGCA